MAYKQLTSPRFSSSKRLKAAANNAPTLRKGASGEAVRIIQKAMLDQKFFLPTSTKKYGTPDGIFGKETKEVVIKFQQKYSLSPDGVIGTNTMQKLNDLFPTWSPVPPPVYPTSYEVPGMRIQLAQPDPQTCWATVYTMIRSWKDRKVYDIATAVGLVSPFYSVVLEKHHGLNLLAMKDFYRDAGLKLENLESLTPEGWVEMLMNYGMLMVGTSYASDNNGLHANLVWGIFGDGTIENTTVAYIDPKDGFNHFEPFADFHRRFLGVDVIEDGLDESKLDLLVQIAHF